MASKKVVTQRLLKRERDKKGAPLTDKEILDIRLSRRARLDEDIQRIAYSYPELKQEYKGRKTVAENVNFPPLDGSSKTLEDLSLHILIYLRELPLNHFTYDRSVTQIRQT